MEGLLQADHHPSYFLLQIDPAKIDVNIHPAKQKLSLMTNIIYILLFALQLKF